MTNTREFIKKATAPGIGLSAGGLSFGTTIIKSYASVVGANQIYMTVIRTHGRGADVAKQFTRQKDTDVTDMGNQEKISVANYLIPFSNS